MITDSRDVLHSGAVKGSVYLRLNGTRTSTQFTAVVT